MQQFSDPQRQQASENDTQYTLENQPSIENPQLYEQQRNYQQGYGQPGAQYGPYRQPQQQFPYAQPPFFASSQNDGGLDGKLMAALSYLGLWLTGFLLVLFVRENRFIRFHAMQSLLFFGAVNVLYIVLISIMVRHVPLIFGFAIFFFVLMNIVAAVAWFVGFIGALSGKYLKLPLVGDFAERFANQGRPPVKWP